ncbi:formylglycine-generating enzyme family protein [Crocinitomicaceae bacterium]|nr:formylglycine-generating enzyme family protein [Crocinitomicaceae bacterium]
MKKLFCLVALLSLFYSCNEVEGNLVGVKGRDVYYPDVLGPGKLPIGMAYVPSGAYQSGEDDEDIMGLHTARKKTVSTQSFYMDATEISNNEYRQFVHWVRDSIAREKLYRRSYGSEAQDWVRIPDDFWMRIGPYGKIYDAGSDVQGGNTPFELFMDSTNNVKVDKAMLLMGTPFDGNGASEKSKAFKNVTKDKLVNGIGLDKKDLEFFWSLSGNKVAKPAVNFFNFENNIFNNYSKPNDPKEFDKGDKTIETKTPSGMKKSKDYQMGRIEARKYLTLDWEMPIDYQDPEVNFLLSDMFYSEQERFYGRREIDTRLLYFDYYWIDYKEAARRGKIITKSVDSRTSYSYDSLGTVDVDLYNRSRRDPLSKDYKRDDLHRSTLSLKEKDKVWVDTTVYTNQVDGTGNKITNPNNYYATILENPGQDLDMGFTNSKGGHNAIRGHTDRSRFIIKERINVYPDTLCWVRDFTYAFHSPMTKNYFWHTAYDNYPVVGVTWTQAKAFSVWRTQIYHSWLQSNGDLFVNDFRLPLESEWERAARGDLEQSQFPWGGPYIRNASGCFLANFKPMRGRYFEDGGFHTVKVYSYNPNGFGLYCMAGNVAEWCSTAFDESQYEFGHDMNSDYNYEAKDGDHPVKKRKVIRGGSWKDIGYYLNNSTRTYEYQDSAKSYIGFRNVMSHLGRGGKDLDLENGEEIQSDIQLK